MKRFILPVVVPGALAAGGLALVLFSFQTPPPVEPVLEPAEEVPAITHPSALMDVAFFDGAYERAPELAALAFPAAGVTVPHHLLAAPVTAAFFEQLGAQNVRRVVVVGPDHLARSSSNVIISRAAWRTPYGTINPDFAIIDGLVRDGLAVVDEPVFELDHSISAVAPFIKRSFPNATIVPILIQEDATTARALAHSLPRDAHTLIIASVDFSHYQPDRVAQFHDRTSRAALSHFVVSELGDLEIDSSQSLAILLEAMSARGAARMTVLANTNSAGLTRMPGLTETTSHLFATWSIGEAQPDSAVTVLAVGDMMFDRDVRTFMAAEGPEYPFARIRGTEDRFFRGIDIVTGNLEGAISTRRSPEKSNDFAFDTSVASLLADLRFDAVNLANNHNLDQGRAGVADTHAALDAAGIGYTGDQVYDNPAPWITEVRGKKIAMLGWNATDNPVDESEAEAAVRAARAAADLVLVQVHWGAEYQPRPTAAQRALGRKFVEWGADAVIGHHPHVMQGMEVWQGKPIFWSLGNFIFDQYFSRETQRGLAVGLALTNNGITLYLFPIVSEKIQPHLAAGEEDRALLETFTERSDISPELQTAARLGIIELSF